MYFRLRSSKPIYRTIWAIYRYIQQNVITKSHSQSSIFIYEYIYLRMQGCDNIFGDFRICALYIYLYTVYIGFEQRNRKQRHSRHSQIPSFASNSQQSSRTSSSKFERCPQSRPKGQNVQNPWKITKIQMKIDEKVIKKIRKSRFLKYVAEAFTEHLSHVQRFRFCEKTCF